MRKTSNKGLALGAAKEAVILTAYPDPGTGGVPWTIGVGHTDAAGGDKVRSGMRWTLQKALQHFKADMARVDVRVNRAIHSALQHEHDGFASFDLNTGAISSGTVDNKWNAGDRVGAMTVLGLYVNAAGKRLGGLVTRRRQEQDIILHNRWPDLRILVKDTERSQGRLVSFDQLPWDDNTVVTISPTLTVPPLPEKRIPQPNAWLSLLDLIGRALQWTSTTLTR